MEKKMKITPVSIKLSDKKTKNGGNMYNLVFKPSGADIDMTATAFSDTIAKAVEDNIGKEVDATFNVREYNGQPSYTLNELAGIKNSGFKKGQGYQRDTVSIERVAAAQVAATLLGYKDVTKSKNLGKEWSDLSDKVYIWISTRPSEPAANGGPTKQVNNTDEYSDADIPPEYK